MKQTVWPKLTRSLLIRIALVAPLVLLCHALEWRGLRVLTTDTLVDLSALLGLPMPRLGWDLVLVGGVQVKFVVACTLVDAFCGAIPLLWRSARGMGWNVLRLAGVAVGFFGLNIFRLEIGFVGMHAGLPWWLAHECVSGITYFAIFVWIVHDWRKFDAAADVGSAAPAMA